MLYYIGFFIALALSFLVGDFGFCQIIGSIQSFKHRGVKASLTTIIIWIAILLLFTWLLLHFFYSYRIAMAIGYGISFIMTLCAGKIE